MREVHVRVTPNARKDGVALEKDVYEISVTARPRDGAANERVCALLAEHFGVPEKDVVVIRGVTRRKKTIRVYGKGGDEK